MRILVVDDQKKTTSFLKKGLSENGFVVDVAHDGEEGLQLARFSDYDLLIVDVMLPRRNGWSIVGELRGSGSETPILYLSALGSVSERVKGLQLGADDYLTKPFSFSELLARVRSLLRRGPIRQSEIIRVAGLEIDLLRHKATRDSKPLNLTPKEFQLLSLLARRSGEVVSRSIIADQIWGINFDTGTNLVDVHIRRLRSKVDDPFDKPLIRTVRGLGYVLETD